MAFPKIYVNGILAGEWDYGYNSFYLNVTNLLKYNAPNTIAIHADTRKHDSRWYPGAGIYRKIQMITVNKIHTAIWGTYVTTPIIKPHYADVRAATTIVNRSKITSEILVQNKIINANGIEIVATSNTYQIANNSEKTVETTLTLPNPHKWDIENPYLYTLETSIFYQNKLTDTYKTTFGVRSIRFTENNGFFLNDKRIQLKGVNLHHDFGPLGAAFNERAMERQLEIMKDMGANAVRTSHNTAAPELLDLCDKMGLLVFNEVFDKYDAKTPQNMDFWTFL